MSIGINLISLGQHNVVESDNAIRDESSANRKLRNYTLRGRVDRPKRGVYRSNELFTRDCE
jgi:hypothetical protein